MPEPTIFSEASLLYADNYYLIESLEKVFKKEIKQLFQTFEKMIHKKKWFNLKEWETNISGTYFEINYQNKQGKNPFFIWLRFRPKDLADDTKLKGEEGKRRSFEIALSIRPEVSNGKEFKERFFKKAISMLKEEDVKHLRKTATAKALVRKTVEYNMSNLLNVMETELDNFVTLAGYAKE